MANYGMSRPTRGRGGQGADVILASRLLDLGQVRHISAKSLEYLGEVVSDKTRETKNRVAAARAVLAHHEWREGWEDEHRPERMLVDMLAKLLGGSEAVQRWLAVPENMDSVRRMLPAIKRDADGATSGAASEEELASALESMQKAGER